MRNFLKAMAAVVVLCASSFAQEVNLEVQSQENAKFQYERYNKMKKIGTGLIIGGLVVSITGSVVMTGAIDIYSPNGIRKGGEGQYATGLIVSFLGSGAFTAGIPIRIVGRVKAKEYKNDMLTDLYLSPNGVKLVWSF
ncbi:MAG: hypothetical protein FWF51_13330 [Chitinivibrionia bacterium]|nr:hypothetical protein [Chitinivibrionia bacterium]